MERVSDSSAGCRDKYIYMSGSRDVSLGDLRVESCKGLPIMCWNVCGWSNLEAGELGREVSSNDARFLVLNHYKPDVVGVVKSWLHKDEQVVFGSINGLAIIEKLSIRKLFVVLVV